MPVSGFHEGGCLCGAVRYRTEGLPVFTIVCHCRACQHRTGSAFGIGAYFPSCRHHETSPLSLLFPMVTLSCQ